MRLTRRAAIAGVAAAPFTPARAQAAKEAAQAQLSQGAELDEAQRTQIEASLARAELRLQLGAAR